MIISSDSGVGKGIEVQYSQIKVSTVGRAAKSVGAGLLVNALMTDLLPLLRRVVCAEGQYLCTSEYSDLA